MGYEKPHIQPNDAFVFVMGKNSPEVLNMEVTDTVYDPLNWSSKIRVIRWGLTFRAPVHSEVFPVGCIDLSSLPGRKSTDEKRRTQMGKMRSDFLPLPERFEPVMLCQLD